MSQNSIEIFYLRLRDRTFYIFVCIENPSNNTHVHIIEVLNNGPQILNDVPIGTFTGTLEGIQIALQGVVSHPPHTPDEQFNLRHEIEQSWDELKKINENNFMDDFGKHNSDFQKNAYRIIKQCKPSLTSLMEKIMSIKI